MLAGLLFAELGKISNMADFDPSETTLSIKHLIQRETQSQTEVFLTNNLTSGIVDISQDKCNPERLTGAMRKQKVEDSKSKLEKWNNMAKAQMTKEMEQD